MTKQQTNQPPLVANGGLTDAATNDKQRNSVTVTEPVQITPVKNIQNPTTLQPNAADIAPTTQAATTNKDKHVTMEIETSDNNNNPDNNDTPDNNDMYSDYWIQVIGNCKRKQSDITATAVDDTNYVLKTKLNQRGEEAIEATECLITPIKVDFSVKTKQQINIREEFLKNFKLMQKVDSSFAILTPDAVFHQVTDIPTNEAFMTTFKVDQNSNQRRNPVVSMFFTSESK